MTAVRGVRGVRRGAPAVIAVPAFVGIAFLFLPLVALLIRAPWSHLFQLLSTTTATTALRLSLECATMATIASFVLGVPLAWVLAQVPFPGRSLVRAAVTVPLVLPPVVGGVALLFALGRFGVIGQYLDRWFGYDIPFTTTAVVIAETFVAMPFLVVTVEGALRSADQGLDEAAATLGASRTAVFWRVTLPLIRPSLLAGSVLCWARALGEFGATVTFAGNTPGQTETMPIAIYNAMQDDPEPAIALSLVLLVVALIVLGAMRERWLGGGTGGVTLPPGGLGPGADGLSVAALVRRGEFVLDVALDVGAGEIVAVLGPNGAGKSTLLRVLAGLTALSSGRVTLAGQVLDDVEGGVFVAPESRPVGLVFQNYRLFPHLSVLDNVAFAPRSRGARRGPARVTAGRWLERFELSELADRKPDQLSGGQAQRVALARALAAEPMLLLLDEPTAALDARSRLAVRTDLRRHLSAFSGPTVLVTHDPLEAMVMADRLIVIEGGRIVQVGAPGEVGRRPATQYVARLVGLNLYAGTRSAGTTRVELSGGGSLVAADADPSGPVWVALRPAAVSVHTSPPMPASPRNVWSGRIGGMELLTDRVRLQVDAAPSTLVDVTPDAVGELGLIEGMTVWLSAKATDVDVYPAS